MSKEAIVPMCGQVGGFRVARIQVFVRKSVMNKKTNLLIGTGCQENIRRKTDFSCTFQLEKYKSQIPLDLIML